MRSSPRNTVREAVRSAAPPQYETHDLLLGHRACLVDLGRVPRAGVYDNEGAIGRWRRGVPQLTAAFQGFRGALGMGVSNHGAGRPRPYRLAVSPEVIREADADRYVGELAAYWEELRNAWGIEERGLAPVTGNLCRAAQSRASGGRP